MRVLRLLNKSSIINESLGTLVLDKGKVLVPVFKNRTGFYVERSTETEQLLSTWGQGYISGSLVKVRGEDVFFRDDPKSFVQLFISGDRDLGIAMPNFLEDGKALSLMDSIETVSAFIDRHFSGVKDRLVSVPIVAPGGGQCQFELYQYKPGFCRNVYLIHNELGLVKLVLRNVYTEKMHKVMLEQRVYKIE